MRRAEQLKRTSAIKRGRRCRTDRRHSTRFWEAARDQRVCAVTHTAGPWDAHHVIEKQELRRRGVDVWDPRNALRVIKPVHERHTLAVKRIPLRCLTDENLRFAFEVMGLAAHPYLHRLYWGEDERVEQLVSIYGAPDACG